MYIPKESEIRRSWVVRNHLLPATNTYLTSPSLFHNLLILIAFNFCLLTIYSFNGVCVKLPLNVSRNYLAVQVVVTSIIRHAKTFNVIQFERIQINYEYFTLDLYLWMEL